jgi:hypothetical protein
VAERFPCPYLDAWVELTEERRIHIQSKHAEVLPERLEWLVQALLDPEMVVRSRMRDDARLFLREYHPRGGARYMVVVVVTASESARSWIVTAYLARNAPKGTIEWRRT